jgi:hypothetical protein
LEIVECGVLRVILEKLNEEDLTLIISKKCLTLLRDIAKND